MKASRLARWLSFSAADSGGRFVLQIVSTVIFARLLAPELFGQAALAMVIVEVLAIGVVEPFEEALARKRVLRKYDLQACLFALLAVAAALYSATVLTLWVLTLESGHAQAVGALVGVYSLTLFANAPNAIYTAVARRRRRFALIAAGNLAGMTVGTLVGIAMALSGAGVWSLVAVRFVYMYVKAVWIAVGSGVRLLPVPAMAPLRELSGFAGWFFASRSAQTITEALLQMLVTMLHGVAANGYLNMATRIVSPLRLAVGPIGHNISMSIFARMQDTPDRLRAAVERTIVQTSLLLLPIFIGMASVAGSVIALLAGPSWHASVEIAVFLALAAAMVAPTNFISSAVTARGRADLRFGSSLLGLLGTVAGLFALAPLGVSGIGPARFFGFFAFASFTVWQGYYLFRMDFAATGRQLLPIIIANITMAAAVVYLPAALPANLPLIALLLCQIVTGLVIYGAAIWLLAGGTLRDAAMQLVRRKAEQA